MPKILQVRQLHTECGSLTGHVRHNGKVRTFDFSWGSHEAYWKDKVCNNSEDYWFGEVVEMVMDAITAHAKTLGHEELETFKADVIHDDGKTTIKSFEILHDVEDRDAFFD